MASRRIEDLHPDFQPMVRKLLQLGSQEMPASYSFFITDGYRSNEEQTQLYALGRTQPGKVVTHAQAGESPHNYGLAVDMAFQKAGVLYYDRDLYDRVYPIARDLGFELGVDWQWQDRPHFQYPNWRNKLKGQETMPEQPQVSFIEHQRNVVVSAADGVNVRLEPNTSSQTKTTFPKGTEFAVAGWLDGQNVAGNNKWWVTRDRYFVWSGATNVIPQKNEEPASATKVEPVPDQATSETLQSKVESQQQVIEAQRNDIKQLSIQLADKEREIDSLTAKFAHFENEYKQVENIKNTNVELSNKIGDLDNIISMQKQNLNNAYRLAFKGWELIEIPAGVAGAATIPVMISKVIGVIVSAYKEGLVLGWKKGAKLYKVNDDGSIAKE